MEFIPAFYKECFRGFLFVLIERFLLGAIDWGIGITNILYLVLNIPFGAIVRFADSYLWHNFDHSSWVNDELTSVSIFGLATICQAVIYYFLIANILKRLWYEKSRKNESGKV